jgi:hypothetical protein
MKKLILILLAAATFASCGDKKKTEDTGATNVTKSDDKPAVVHKNAKTDLTAKAKIPYFDASAEIKVNSVTMDFWPKAGEGDMFSDPQEKGRQIVRVEFTITGTSKEPYYLSSSGFKLKGADGKEEMTTSLINDGNSKDRQKENEKLKKGQSVTYADYFEIDGKQTADDLTLLIDGEKDKSIVVPVKFKK